MPIAEKMVKMVEGMAMVKQMFEEGAQIRKSSKSVRSTIVEGYGRRKHKQDFIRFLSYALASNDETTDHLETLFETESLTDRQLYKKLHERSEMLGRKNNLFMQSVQKNHISEK